MKTVSFQGVQLSANQRRQQAFQQQIRVAFMSPHLQETVDQTIAAVELRKEQGAKPERLWTVDRQESGTVCVAEWMGF